MVSDDPGICGIGAETNVRLVTYDCDGYELFNLERVETGSGDSAGQE